MCYIDGWQPGGEWRGVALTWAGPVLAVSRETEPGHRPCAINMQRLVWFCFECLFYCVENDANVAKKCPRRRLIDGRRIKLTVLVLVLVVHSQFQLPRAPHAHHSAAQLGGRAYPGAIWPLGHLAIWQATWTRLQSFFMATDCIEYFVRNKIQIYLR